MPNAKKKIQTSHRAGIVDIAKIAVLEVDGKQYRLVYDFGEIAMAEKVADCNLLQALYNLGDLNGVQLRGLLYAAIKPLNAAVTIDEVTAMMRPDTIGEITRCLAEAYVLSGSKKASGS